MTRSCSTLTSAALALALVLGAPESSAKTSWQLVYSQPNQGNALIGLAAVDATHGWTVGIAQQGSSSSPVGLRTMDGVTWSPMMLPSGGGGPFDLRVFTQLAFADDQHGWLFGLRLVFPNEESVLWRTDNGGSSWTEAFKATEPLEQLQALPDGQLFAAGGTTLVRSPDGQQVNEVSVTLPAGLGLSGVFMLNADCGYLVAATEDGVASAHSAVLWSEDGGESWEVRADALAHRLERAWFVSADRGWVAGTDGQGAGVVVRTTDGGRSWMAASVPDHPPVIGRDTVPVTECVDVRFFDESRGLALCLACTGNCDSGQEQPSYLTVFARSNDGGASWQMDPDYEPHMSAPPFGDLVKFSGMFAMAFPEPNAGFLAGQNNLVLRYTADEPEPAGWGPASCEPGTPPGDGGAGSGGSAANAAEADEDSGCGCRTHPAGSTPAAWLFVALGLATLGAWRRRRSRSA